jgi:DNA (cytosine-5)-methyltransferase 1
MATRRFGFYEFFAGGGMARLGLGGAWDCIFANDICPKKARSYRENFGSSEHLVEGDVASLAVADLPGRPTLVWGSFPCQDLSLAGARGGLQAKRSGAFWPFWKLAEGLRDDKRPPPIVVLENVVGALTANEGQDFVALATRLTSAGYRIGALVMDAAMFVPQSRPRLFVVAVHEGLAVPERLIAEACDDEWHPRALRQAHDRLPSDVAERWIWWRMPRPPKRPLALSDVIENEPVGVAWHTAHETKKVLAMMSPMHRKRVEELRRFGRRVVGTIYRRTRLDEGGRKVQRAEVRFDQIGGCLRTPGGGSSRQTIIIVDGESVRTRLLSPREAARLMGVPDTYVLPANYNEAYHLMGDGVVVPVIAWLEESLLRPLARAASGPRLGLEREERPRSTLKRPSRQASRRRRR